MSWCFQSVAQSVLGGIMHVNVTTGNTSLLT